MERHVNNTITVLKFTTLCGFNMVRVFSTALVIPQRCTWRKNYFFFIFGYKTLEELGIGLTIEFFVYIQPD